MDIKELDQLLTPEQGRLTLTADLLPDAHLDTLLTTFNAGQPLVIGGAEKKTGQTKITVTGTSFFMLAPDLPVSAVFGLDNNGTPTASFRFNLNSWAFNTSFPNLPPFPEFVPIQPGTCRNMLDELCLSEVAFILNTTAGRDAETGAPLSEGLNFVAKLVPVGILGLLDNMLGGHSPVLLYGTIIMPTEEKTPAIPGQKYPWDQLGWAVPGIRLQADLGISFNVGKLTLDTTVLQIYCPLTTEWLSKNPTYTPDLGVTGILKIQNTDLGLSVNAMLNKNAVTIDGIFENFSINNLSELAHIAPGCNDINHLPPVLQSEVEKLENLNLMAVGIGFTDKLSPEAVNYSYVTVGMPTLDWPIFNGLKIEEISAQFRVWSPFSDPKISVTLFGKLDVAGACFNIYTGIPDFTVHAELERTATVKLHDFFKAHLPELPQPPDLSIGSMEMRVSPGKSYAFTATMADDPEWKLDLGPVGLTICNVFLDLNKQKDASATGAFGGSLALNDRLYVDAEYSIPGDFSVRAQLPELKLSDIIRMFDPIGITLPHGFDVVLKESYVLINENGDGITFTAATSVSDLGLLAFTAQKSGEQTGVAVGIALETENFAQIAGLDALKAFNDFVGLEKVMLVVSSLDQPGFQFPDMKNFNTPALEGKNLKLPKQASGLVTGLNLYAQLSTTKSKGFQTLAKYLRIKLDGSIGITLAISLPDPTKDTKLFLAVSEEIQKGTTLSGELGGLLQGGEVGAFLTGKLKTIVQSQSVEFSVTALVLEAGVLIEGSIKGAIDFNPLYVKLSNPALVIGLDWEGIPSLGIAATLDVKKFNSAVAIFFDSTDPAKSMVAGAVSDLNLSKVVTSIAGQSSIPPELDNEVLDKIGLKGINAFNMPADEKVVKALDNRDIANIATAFKTHGNTTIPDKSDGILLEINTPGSVWHLTDMTTMLHYSLMRQDNRIRVDLEAQIYCAPQETHIGEITFPQAFYVIAEIDYLILQEKIKVIVNPKKGISADVDVSPIIIYKENFFEITAAEGKGGPRLSLSTFDQPSNSDPRLSGPHFMLNGKLKLMGVDIFGTYISISSKGFDFAIKQQVNPILYLDLEGNFDSLNSMRSGGHVLIGLDRNLELGPLGSINVKTDVKGSVDLGYKDGKAYATFKGSFDFEGIHGDIPTLSLNVNVPALSNIADTVWDQVKDIIEKALKDADQWLNWVKNGVVRDTGQTAQAVGKVLKEVYHLQDSEIAKTTKDILGYGIKDITYALNGAGTVANEAFKILLNLGYQAEDISNAIAGVFKNIHVDTNFGHVDTKGPHVDTPKWHIDTPRVHTDQATFLGHVDKTEIPHGDTIKTPHADTTPHVDQGTHVDINS